MLSTQSSNRSKEVTRAALVTFGSCFVSQSLPAAPPENGISATAPSKGMDTPSPVRSPMQSPQVSPDGGIIKPSPASVSTEVPDTAAVERNVLIRSGLSVLGPLLGMTSMGWYYLQLRSRQTAGNLTTSMLAALNSAVLLGGACLTEGQGLAATSLYGVFCVLDLLVGRELWKQRREERVLHQAAEEPFQRLTPLEKVCIVGGVTGMVALAASKMQLVHQLIDPSMLVLGSNALATVVGCTNSLPLLMMLIAKPLPEERLAKPNGRLRAILKPVVPYMLGTCSFACAALGVQEASVATLLAPVGFMAHSLLLTGAVGVWAWRRTF
jgi:hypothetical protein